MEHNIHAKQESKTRVALFKSSYMSNLESEINNFLKNYSSEDVVDIQYRVENTVSYQIHYSAMVVVKEEK